MNRLAVVIRAGLGLAAWTFGVSSEPVGLGIPPSVRELAWQGSVRIVTAGASGSGVIVARATDSYTVLTSWHVLEYANHRATAIAPDHRRFALFDIQQVGQADLAIARFRSNQTYQTLPIATVWPSIGERVYAAGFPMLHPGTAQPTFDLGRRVFRITAGTVGAIAPKLLQDGYRLGYSNDVVLGMSGGPILNEQGQLVGINGRLKQRDPGFGGWTFADGSQPSAAQQEQFAQLSWGILLSHDAKPSKPLDVPLPLGPVPAAQSPGALVE